MEITEQEKKGIEYLAVSLPIRILVAVVCEMLYYISYVFRVPLMLCIIALAAFIVITLQDIYPQIAAVTTAPLLGLLPENFDFNFNNGGVLKLYAQLSSLWYIITRPIQLAFSRLAKITYKLRFGVAAGFVTLGYVFVFLNVPFMQMAPGTSRLSMFITFFVFYLLTLVGFAGALALSFVADLFVAWAHNYFRDVLS